MTWILIDLAIALLALAVLAVLVLGLWRRVKALASAVTAAGETVGRATDALAEAQAAGPLSAPPAGSTAGMYISSSAPVRVPSSAGAPRVPVEGRSRGPLGA